MPKPPQNRREFNSLLDVVQSLRGPEGCPWDREQTHESLVRFAIEETYELAEALENPNSSDKELIGELGDVLFQVVLHSEIARQEKRFDIFDVIQNLNEKMIRRHPHVFSDVKVSDSEEVIQNWQKIKEKEKNSSSNEGESPLKTPPGLPSLMEASKIGSKTKKFGFDWNEVSQVLHKVREEIDEIEEVLDSKEKVSKEIGDALFSLAQLARHLNLDPETSLRKTNQRFRRRFDFMLNECQGDLEQFSNLSAEEKEKLWEKAKTQES